MRSKKLLTGIILAFLTVIIPINGITATSGADWEPLIDIAFERNDLEMAVLGPCK